MASKTLKPVAAALGAAFLASSVVPMAAAGTMNPFAAEDLASGYDLANYDKHKEGNCGEGKCGGSMGDKDKAAKDGNCGGNMDANKDKAAKDGNCGGNMDGHKDKAEKEGKCGEGKCGENK